MRFLTFYFLVIPVVSMAQNLVSNPGFEIVQDTQFRFTLDYQDFERIVPPWTIPNKSTPDIIMPGFQEDYVIPPPPHSGSHMVGMQASIHACEYVGVALQETLVPYRTYLCEFWIRRSKCFAPERDKDEYFNDYFGLLFTKEILNREEPEIIAAKPQVTGNTNVLVTKKEWIKVSNYFTPKSAFNYLYLGQFLQLGNDPPMMHSYYVADDISVQEISNFEALDRNLPLAVGTIIPLNAVTFLSGTTTFQNNSAKNTLSELADYLEANPDIKIRINGHTDSKGSKRSNVDLSNRRAEYVASVLVSYGVKTTRIEWKGFGEEIPIDDNKTVTGRARNRRVEFEVVE